MNKEAQQWIDKLGLHDHPEGGYFKETYRSHEKIPQRDLPANYQGDRNFSTAIYFLLKEEEFSAFHRLKGDELWHYHAGDPLEIFVINPDGNLEKYYLGPQLDAGEQPQAIIFKNQWFAARVNNPTGYTLMSCTMTPGFEFADFEMAKEVELIRQYPHHRELIKRLTRQ